MRLYTEREIKLIAFGTAAITLIAVAIAMVVSLSRNNRSSAPEFSPEPEISIDVTDLYVPEYLRTVTLSEHYVFRPRLERWTSEQIDRFWIDPRILQLEELRRETDDLIRSYFETVP